MLGGLGWRHNAVRQRQIQHGFSADRPRSSVTGYAGMKRWNDPTSST
jgi:hypothetical protein